MTLLGDVAVDKDVAGACTGEDRLWDARVGAPDPEDLHGVSGGPGQGGGRIGGGKGGRYLGALTLGAFAEEGGFGAVESVCPLGVGVEEGVYVRAGGDYRGAHRADGGENNIARAWGGRNVGRTGLGGCDDMAFVNDPQCSI